MIHRRPLLLPALLILLAGRAVGQLDLPGKPVKPKDEPASALAPVAAPKGDLAPKSKSNPLELPPTAAATAPAAVPAKPASADDAARFIFDELAKTHELQLAAHAVESLLAVGPAALPVARSELGSSQPAVLLAAGRTLLLAGSSADRAAVVARLQRALPPEVGPPLLEELLARDPMLASPEFLASLLEHPSTGLRSAATKALETRASPALLPTLAPYFSSTRTVTRSAVLELVGRVDDPAALHLLVSRLGDASAQLASRAAELLSSRAEAEPLLLERAFPPQALPGGIDWDRARAYALLALVEREESQGLVLLDETRIETLRGGLSSSLPLVAGVCAIALAHIGFRAPASHTGSWLDREVPHQLVRTGTGAEFHTDFSSLERPALRALALLAGEGFGQDGEAWRRWWLDAAEGFHARHGVVELTSDAPAHLSLTFSDGGKTRWTLRAAELPDVPGAPSSDPVLLLDQHSAERILARLQSDGIFGGERPPSGSRKSDERFLVVAVGEQTKRFAFPTGASAPWFERLLVELSALVEENRWQLLFDPARTTRRDWWQAEHERWAAYAPLERQRALKNLWLEAAGRVQSQERARRLAELNTLYHELGVPESRDVEPLLTLLVDEPAFGPNAELLCELVRIAAGAEGADAGAPESAATGKTDSMAGRQKLIALCLEHFGPEADAALARVARDLDSETLVGLAHDPRPRARALAAPGLLRAGSAHERELVLALLNDPEPTVVLATLAALGSAPFEEARAPLFERAKSGSPELRSAALAALSHLGGAGVFDLALAALAEGDESLQRAAVSAMAELADPRGASLLASLLARGSSSPLFADARRGLQRIGPAGLDECLRLSHSANTRTRREAALLLSEQLVPEAAGLLLTLLTEDPSDERVAWELAVLSGVDLRSEPHPETAWWNWWDMVVHDDPLAWLLAAAQRVGFDVPAREILTQHDNPAGARFLLRLLDANEPALVERAARELERRLGVELPRPSGSAERGAWRNEVAEVVRAHFGG